MIYSLYKVTDPNGRCYIGCTSRTVEQRWQDHRGFSAHIGYPRNKIGHAIERFGKEAFTVEHIASAVGVHAAKDSEAALIAQCGTLYPHGYNIVPAGPLRGSRSAA